MICIRYPACRLANALPFLRRRLLTETAYVRSDLFERRRVLMENWAAYLAGARRPENSSRR